MWMEELPNGKYKFFERYKDPYTEKLKKVSVTMEKKTSQARNQAALLLQEKIQKKLNTKNEKNITFGEVYNLFYQQWKKTVKESTKHSYSFIDNVIKKEGTIYQFTPPTTYCIYENIKKGDFQTEIVF